MIDSTKIYGSVDGSDIIEELAKHDIVVPINSVSCNLKEIGDFVVDVCLDQGDLPLKVRVEAL